MNLLRQLTFSLNYEFSFQNYRIWHNFKRRALQFPQYITECPALKKIIMKKTKNTHFLKLGINIVHECTRVSDSTGILIEKWDPHIWATWTRPLAASLCKYTDKYGHIIRDKIRSNINNGTNYGQVAITGKIVVWDKIVKLLTLSYEIHETFVNPG